MCSWFWLLSTIDKWRRGRALRVHGTDRPRGPLAKSSDAHNDKRWLGPEVRRTYVYSDEDALIKSSDVEAHAAEAEARGFVVRREKFTSPHVAHARDDPERYWRIAKETFTGTDPVEDTQPEADAVSQPEAEVTL
ncbi:hypothetical protein A1Q1_04208 [Trichosporon asahii var. asahii CBS 2479]|uniref:Uncharacterized protein n=1 Tax=Trichosporon asahii var. asahii (strain ATCC 90039 / CBS 2479 / JCM 2466 / KCTC 7840 / NBRC 103889/ NCYC 2677 / UAMH 7654) TaxID=1186058 RepID=J4U8V2_TRIAS|nr:hypothetical protein A1Q1_04208 [Trichosporon asahii var. asahii CBS 2479]EJT46965.1 hypothetical protein A1Q1_04208 [Trichosporon asahii var. asahii CBS 2479]